MKKSKSNSLKTFFLGMLIFALTIFSAMGGAYAYFTATATKKQESLTTATIMIDVVDTNQAITTTASVGQTELLPGSIFTYSGKVKNTGSSPIYALLELNILIDDVTTFTQYYTATGTVVDKQGVSFTTAATSLTAGNTSDFQISYTFTGAEFDDSFKGKTIKFKVVAHAIQTANIQNGVVATNIMLGGQVSQSN